MRIQSNCFDQMIRWLGRGMFFSILLMLSCCAEVNYTPPEGSTEIAITHFSFASSYPFPSEEGPSSAWPAKRGKRSIPEPGYGHCRQSRSLVCVEPITIR
jgi:hypothetical protein